ncbi:MAG TPA: zf-HC2 domain-containing protein [Dehalococcoidia bacterium]|nr:zf-HC2 domain-containing protein [Dehalococcoidia bacterium]
MAVVKNLLAVLRRAHQPDTTLSAYVDGSASESQRARVEAHVLACPRCAQRLEHLRSVRSALASLPQLDAPRSFRLHASDVAKPVPASGPSFTARAIPALAAAAVVAFAVLVAVDVRGGGTATSSPQLARSAAYTAAMKQAANAGALASGTSPAAAAGAAAPAVPPEASAQQPGPGLTLEQRTAIADSSATVTAGGAPATAAADDAGPGSSGQPDVTAPAGAAAPTPRVVSGTPGALGPVTPLPSGAFTQKNSGAAPQPDPAAALDSARAHSASNATAAAGSAQSTRSGNDSSRPWLRWAEVGTALAAAALALIAARTWLTSRHRRL